MYVKSVPTTTLYIPVSDQPLKPPQLAAMLTELLTDLEPHLQSICGAAFSDIPPCMIILTLSDPEEAAMVARGAERALELAWRFWNAGSN